MYHPLRIIKEKCQTVIKNQWQLLWQRHYQVQFYNIWEGQSHDELYWYQFLKGRRLLDTDKKIAIFSVFGDRELIDRVKADVKIFYSAENLKRGEYAQYKDNALGVSTIDMSMGLEVIEDPRYIRFPLWMDYIFPADCMEDYIRAKCQQLRFPGIDRKNKFCCMVASNGEGNLREDMFNRISLISHVDSAGKYLHNDDTLKKEFGDVKVDYMKQYLFNICPENSDAYGYTTEKVFEAISVGCIPIYWGAKFADKDVINEEAVIWWNKNDDGLSALKQIKELHDNPKLLQEFLAQPRLLPSAEEYIIDTFATIERRIRELINNR